MSKTTSLPEDVPIEFRPEVRWWLSAGHHTDETLRNEVATAHKLGFGGMEFLAMDEPNISLERYGWGSAEWKRSSDTVLEETTKRGMSVSFTSGTNWSNANIPGINPDHPAAAQELDYVYEDLKGGEKRSGPAPKIDLAAIKAGDHATIGKQVPVHEQFFVGAVAGKLESSDGDSGVLSSVMQLPSLDWTAPEGTWRIFYFWSHGTGQTAEPSSSVNYTVNYLDPDGCKALCDYWKTNILTPEVLRTIAKNKRTQMYMDSLELSCYGRGGVFWGRTVLAEFEKRRGYSVIPYLPFMVKTIEIMMEASARYHYEPAGDSVSVEKARFDLVHTFTDLYIENMLGPFRAFLNSNNITLRSEISYGLPFELSRPGVEVDGVETESLEFGSQVDGYRLLAGVAHLFGKQYSSETGAHLRNFMLNHQFYDQIINTQLAVGCTKTVLHGWASTAGAEGTSWPGHEGMWPMFSERFDYRQPGSDFYPFWTKAIGRLQWALRQGRPRIDVGIIRTDHATDNLVGLATTDKDGWRTVDEVAYGTMWMRNRQNHWWRDLGMQDAGWSYEFFDGQLLLDKRVEYEGVVQDKGPGYQALIIYQSSVDPDVAKQLLAWAKKGLPVLLVHDTTETKFLFKDKYYHYPRAAARTHGNDRRDEELAATIKEILALSHCAEIHDQSKTLSTLRKLGVKGRAEFAEENRNVLSHLRDDGDQSFLYLYHFLYDTGKPTTARVKVPRGGRVHRIDHYSGSIIPWPFADTLEVKLSPGEVALFRIDHRGQPTSASKFATVIAEIPQWELTVASWDAGEVKEITQKSDGYETKEYQQQTAKTDIHVGRTSLAPWTKISKVGPEVSGIGTYSSKFSIEKVDNAARYILNLGSTGGALGSIRVNDGQECGFDTSAPIVDITEDVKDGSNSIVVKVSSSLNNRLKARGYYKPMDERHSKMFGKVKSPEEEFPIREYGLMGPVTVSIEE